jgi:hypothetical protein
LRPTKAWAIKPRRFGLEVSLPETILAAVDDYRFATRAPNRDIWRTANELIKEFGDLADIEAAARADAHENKGNLEGQRVWLKILNAVVELQKARPGETKH